MPARGMYHDTVRSALVKDGWTITHDPFKLEWGAKDLFVDLGAEQLVAAVKANVRIAVEIKSFLGPSDVEDLEQALGLRSVPRRIGRDRTRAQTLSRRSTQGSAGHFQ